MDYFSTLVLCLHRILILNVLIFYICFVYYFICCLFIWIFFSFLKANIGQDEDFDAARKKAESLGAVKASNLKHFFSSLTFVILLSFLLLQLSRILFTHFFPLSLHFQPQVCIKVISAFWTTSWVCWLWVLYRQS